MRKYLKRQALPVWFAAVAFTGLGIKWALEFKEKGGFSVVRFGGAGEPNSGTLAMIIVGVTLGFGVLLLGYCPSGVVH